MACNPCQYYSQIKPPLTPEKQLEQLKKRGLTFGDEVQAKEVLSKISYSRLRPYWYHFENNHKEQTFKPGTRFEDVLALYNFDNALRQALFEALGRIEVALRASWANRLSLNSQDPFAYLDFNLYFDLGHHVDNIKQLINIWKKSMKNNRDPILSKYHESHCSPDSCPPAWLAGETITFGLLTKLFVNLKNDLPVKTDIASDFGFQQKNVIYFGKVLRLLVLARNRAAHHARLWDYKWKAYNLPKKGYGKVEPLYSALQGTNNLSNYYLFCHVAFLDKRVIGTKTFVHTLLDLLKSLDEQMRQLVLKQMGFPEDFASRLLWRIK